MISIKNFKGLPLEYESFLVKKYDSFTTTCRFLEIEYPEMEYSYMLIFEEDSLIELLIFGRNQNIISCFNTLVSIDSKIIDICTQKLFFEYPSARKICINRSYNEIKIEKAVLCYKYNDYVIDLPATIDDYWHQLGQSTRKTIRNRKSRLTRDYPDVKIISKYRADIKENIVNKLVDLNIARMKYKGVVPAKNDSHKTNIFRYSQHCGLLVYIEIDGEIVAGNIAYIINKRIYSLLVAHDERFSDYNVAKISLLFLIQTSIENGLTALHLLWGNYDYKMHFLGQPRPLYSYSIYKSRSVHYFVDIVKTKVLQFFLDFRQTKFVKPLRDFIRKYRSKKWKT